MTQICIHQIYFDEASKAALDPGFMPLDNSSCERPDWFEYYPIKSFALHNALDEDAYYGFFSWKFGSKTNLSSDNVKSFIRANDGADVILFCPFFEQVAFFVNVFEQGNVAHPGLLQVSQEFAAAAGIDVDLKTLVTDTTNTVYANFFVAKPRFWREWLRLADLLFKQAEDLRPTGSISLITPTYHNNTEVIHFKVFVVERLASLILATRDVYKVAAYELTELPILRAALAPFLRQALVCDALKVAYRRLKNQRYLDEYFAIRGVVFEALKNQMARERGEL